MPILTVRHVTSYHYRQPVAFGEHRMMLRPRDDGDQKVLESELDITPEPSEIAWTRDGFGNHVAIARFARPRQRAALRKHDLRRSRAGRLSRRRYRGRRPATYPFAYTADERPILRASSRSRHADPTSRAGRAGFLRADGTADTHALLIGMTQTIKRTFRHGARHQKGTQEPVADAGLASGSCRDLAVLMIAGLRSLGFAARFVSGYLNLADPDDDSLTGGNTHAWVQAYRARPRLGRFRSVERHDRKRESRARRGRAPAARGDPACKAPGSVLRRTISP